ncbi:hypothetical protein L7F22_051574 [Adiantum nelumboides]|nr:hypothetical protein [Adiantum nelumboides]
MLRCRLGTNRSSLVSFYEDGSMLTFKGQKVAGVQNIMGNLTGLAFQECKHNVSTINCQLSGPCGGMLVFVSDNMQLPGKEHALKFSQLFHLLPNEAGSFYVHNDIFRLNYS